MSGIDKAIDLFGAGCGCSQAVLAAHCEGLGLDQDIAMRIAAGFAGGMRVAGTCGAVTGALMVLGLRHAGDKCRTQAGREGLYGYIRRFNAEFAARNGSLLCRELLDCDISTPEGLKQAVEKRLFRTRCADLVRSAAKLLAEMTPEDGVGNCAR